MFKRIGLLVMLFLHGLLGELSPCLSLLSHAEMAEWLVDLPSLCIPVFDATSHLMWLYGRT